jgi:hypothetical protein
MFVSVPLEKRIKRFARYDHVSKTRCDDLDELDLVVGLVANGSATLARSLSPVLALAGWLTGCDCVWLANWQRGGQLGRARAQVVIQRPLQTK